MIKAQVINAGMNASDAFNALVYNAPDQRLLGYLQNNMSQAYNRVVDTGQAFMEGAQSLYQRFNNSDIIKRGKALLHSTGTHIDPYSIYPLTMEQLPQANYGMQNYIMASPDMWTLHHVDQAGYGFMDTYLNPDPDIRSYEDHRHYQHVVDNVILYDQDGEPYTITYTDSYDESSLHFMDKVAILDTWDAVKLAIANGIDPSSPEGDEL